jgi:hypothetical protein
MKKFVEILSVPFKFGLPGVAGDTLRHRLSKPAL